MWKFSVLKSWMQQKMIETKREKKRSDWNFRIWNKGRSTARTMLICLHTCCASADKQTIDKTKLREWIIYEQTIKVNVAGIRAALTAHFMDYSATSDRVLSQSMRSIFISLSLCYRTIIKTKSKKIPSDFRACNIRPASNYSGRIGAAHPPFIFENGLECSVCDWLYGFRLFSLGDCLLLFSSQNSFLMP